MLHKGAHLGLPLAVPGGDHDAGGGGAAQLLAAAPRDGVVQRVVPLAPDHLRQDAAARVDEPVAYLRTPDITYYTETKTFIIFQYKKHDA